MTDLQVILDASGNPAFAVIPWQEYERLARAADEALTDEELYDRAKAAEEESFPIAVADRLLAGENPIKVYRSYRGMTQRQLATAAAIKTIDLSQIEAGKRPGSPQTLAAIAQALNVNVDDLIL